MLTPEQEKFVVDLFTMYQKQNQINALAEQRVLDEKALSVEYKIDEVNSKRTALVNKFSADTAQLKSEIQDLQNNLTK